MKKLSNTEAKLKKSVAYKKSVWFCFSKVKELTISYYGIIEITRNKFLDIFRLFLSKKEPIM